MDDSVSMPSRNPKPCAGYFMHRGRLQFWPLPFPGDMAIRKRILLD